MRVSSSRSRPGRLWKWCNNLSLPNLGRNTAAVNVHDDVTVDDDHERRTGAEGPTRRYLFLCP